MAYLLIWVTLSFDLFCNHVYILMYMWSKIHTWFFLILTVGNIPYEASEEQLKEIFSEVGPVVSFRSVYLQ